MNLPVLVLVRGPQQLEKWSLGGFQIQSSSLRFNEIATTRLACPPESLSDRYHPYVRPQEAGNKTDVRWFSLRNSEGLGLQFRAAGGKGPLGALPEEMTESLERSIVDVPHLSFSALHFTQEDLDDGPRKDQRHSGQLTERALVALNVDLMQMGVGGITSWGPTGLPEYSLPYGPYEYTFTMRPLSGNDR
jgi:beta-galactosidase